MRNVIYLLIISICTIIIFNIWSCSKFTQNSYASLQPETQYVGIQSCRPCHEDIYNDYIQTGMGKSFYQPSESNIIETFDKNTVVYDTFSGYYYHPFRQGNQMFVREFKLNHNDTTYQRTEKIDYIIGSGNATRSYIINRNGYLYEVPITWYSLRRKWDLSPGYEKGQNSRFNRAVGLECMACHNGHVEFDAGTVNRFVKVALGIDCENCHGPGSEHVRKMKAGEEIDVGKHIDYSIVNPKKLAVEKSFDVCQQCHLPGTSVFKTETAFRPAQALSEQREVFIPLKKDLNSFGISSHAERLRHSACFLQSKGKMTCVTCHNPHQSVHKTDKNFFTKACQKCHQPQACTEKQAVKDQVQNNCITCHMPKGGTSDIPHVRFTDHYIRVKGKEKAIQPHPVLQSAYLSFICATNPQPSDDALGKAYLLYYERHQARPELLTIALEKLAPESRYERAKSLFYLRQYQQAFDELLPCLEKKPQDTWALFLKGELLEAMNQPVEASQTFMEVYKINPYITEAGVKEAVLGLKARPNDPQVMVQASQTLEKVLQTKPHDVSALVNLGFIRLQQNRKEEARRLTEKALAYEPDHPLAKRNLGLMK